MPNKTLLDVTIGGPHLGFVHKTVTLRPSGGVEFRQTEQRETSRSDHTIVCSRDEWKLLVNNWTDVGIGMKYIISADVYMFQDEQKMYSFEGTYRDLLVHLTFGDDFAADEYNERPAAFYTNEELEKWFADANGDGQPFLQVWSVEEDKQLFVSERTKA